MGILFERFEGIDSEGKLVKFGEEIDADLSCGFTTFATFVADVEIMGEGTGEAGHEIWCAERFELGDLIVVLDGFLCCHSLVFSSP